MRTNTWLGLIWFNQNLDGIHRSALARAQADRDKARDEMFAKAQEEAGRGQFAMWIQTPDGQAFERWSGHALLASRVIDDRQTAWDMAWEQDLEERREKARPAAIAHAESMVARVPTDQAKRARPQAISATTVAAVFMIVWLVLVMVAPVSETGEVTATPASIVAFALMGVSGVAAFWFFWTMNADKRRSRLVADVAVKRINDTVLPRSTSWHRRADVARLREVESMIAGVVTNAATSFPRRDSLVRLAGTYDTRPEVPEDEYAPEAIQRLLAAFREEDRERKAALVRDGVA